MIDDLPLEAQFLIDAVCTEFEEAWRKSRRPAEEFLERVPLGMRATLLRELLHCEFELRAAEQDSPRPSEYGRRVGAVVNGDPGNTPFSIPETSTPETTRLPMVPGYELLAEAGRGGMGVVYKARHLGLGRLVALKMILAGEYAGPEAVARFRTEARAVASLRHPNIVQVHDAGECEGRPYQALEYCEGGSLDAKLRPGPLDAREAARLTLAVAEAVACAHAAGILHRDLKPANVLLTRVGVPKVADFGLARQMDQSRHTQSGVLVGTPSYMAPEQAEAKSDIGPPADVWALGAILYECLTGRPPFRADTVARTLRLVLEVEPAPPRLLAPDVPPDLETVCLKCLDKEPSRRYAGAGELADDLGRFLQGRPTLARPVGALTRVAKWSRRNPAVAGLGGALVTTLVVGLALMTLLWRQARHHAEESDQHLRQSLEATGSFMSIANKILANADLIGQEEREELIRGQERMLPLLEKLKDPEDLHGAAWRSLQMAIGLHKIQEHQHAGRVARLATHALGRAAESHPDQTEWAYDEMQGRWALGGILMAGGKPDEGFRFRQEAIRDFEVLRHQHRENDRYWVDLTHWQLTFAAESANRGMTDEAERLFRIVRTDLRHHIERKPDDRARYDRYCLALYRYKASLLSRTQDVARFERACQEGIDLCEKVRRERADWHAVLEPFNYCYGEAAKCHLVTGQPEKAIELYERELDLARALAAKTGKKEHRLLHLACLYDLAAVRWVVDPTGGSARMGRAIAMWDELLREFGDNPKARAALAIRLLVCPDPQHRSAARALELAREIVQANPVVLHYRTLLGWCLCAAGRLDEGAKELEQCLERTPTGEALGWPHHAYLAIARQKRKDYAPARSHLKKATEGLMAELNAPPWDWREHDDAWRLIEGDKPPPRPRISAPAERTAEK